MYKCNECKNIFELDDIIVEKFEDSVEFWGANVSMPYYEEHCPHCYSQDFEEFYEGEEDD